MGAGNSVIDMKLWSINYNTRMNYNTTTRINNDLIRDIMNDLINETIVASEKNKHIISPIWKEREKENN